MIWKRRGRIASEPKVKQIGGVKEVEVPTLVRRSLPRKEMGQVTLGKSR